MTITPKKKNLGINRAFKITAVGDGMVGKTCMLITYVHEKFPTEYVPTVFDNYSKTINIDGNDLEMTLWDTAGQEDYERIRPLSYPNTDCFLLCYSVGNKASFDNISSKWSPELKHHCPNVPIILIATKTDLRENHNDTIDKKCGKKLKRQINAVKFIECSALKQENIKDIFIEAVRASIRKNTKKKFCFF